MFVINYQVSLWPLPLIRLQPSPLTLQGAARPLPLSPLYFPPSISSLYTLHTSCMSYICSSYLLPLFAYDSLSLLPPCFGASLTSIFLIKPCHPSILLSCPISITCNPLSCPFITVHVSQPYNMVGIIALYTLIVVIQFASSLLLSLWRCCSMLNFHCLVFTRLT